MKYDFTTLYDRHGKDSIAVDFPRKMSAYLPSVDVSEGVEPIPMWVADMNFATAPAVTKAMAERLAHPLFGYFETREEYFDAIKRWQRTRNGVEGLETCHIGYENGVLGGVASAVRALTSPGDAVLIHSPTYIGFTGTINSLGRRIVLSPLKQFENGYYCMNYEDMDRKLKEEKIHVAIFCSPHNPSGRVWEREEIEQAMEVFRANHCIVISDEIWSDLTLPGSRHIPTQSVSEDARDRTIALYAPSKTFNLAGLVGSYHIIYNSCLKDRVVAESRSTHYNAMNIMSMYALIGAYSDEGAEWVDELREVLKENVDFACDHINSFYKGVLVSKPEGTYMIFPDFYGWCRSRSYTLTELIRLGWNSGVIWQDGRPFHGNYSIRMNLALPHSKVREAFKRLDWILRR